MSEKYESGTKEWQEACIDTFRSKYLEDPVFRKKYENMYVAIRPGEVVDADHDLKVLTRKYNVRGPERATIFPVGSGDEVESDEICLPMGPFPDL